ncbi:hypothetical protein scyTo_0018144 [Scyliorhinus torazame]|uniref:Uncharacterized protein n=1 Tax=Scyliorhinus torazame TaxID=75743 RepID=A0A401PP99_SCYTO|nr:hypothetical protein [Scyliorhinus torazame]
MKNAFPRLPHAFSSIIDFAVNTASRMLNWFGDMLGKGKYLKYVKIDHLVGIGAYEDRNEKLKHLPTSRLEAVPKDEHFLCQCISPSLWFSLGKASLWS